MELISVIVPVYKVEPYLDRCVESIVNQTYRNLEIILVDDGSPDNCPAMCDAWAEKDSRIKVIHKENGGLSDARNAGMAAASGELIGFVDSDDWIDKEMYQLLYERMIADGSDISACDVQFVYDDSAAAKLSANTQSAYYCAEDALRYLIHGEKFRAVAWNKLYRKQLLQKETFPIGRYHEDEFFTYRILSKAFRLTYVDVPLYFYRQRSGSIMDSVSIKHLDALDAGLERLNFLKKYYPKLYAEDKAGFCVACVSFYRSSSSVVSAELSLYKSRIRKIRSNVHFSFRELCGYSLKQVIYIVGSGKCMDLFCKILNVRRKK